MSNVLGADLYELTTSLPRFLKYPILTAKTISVFLKNRKKIIFLQNPSIVLCFVGIILKSIFGTFVVIDEHNAGIYPLEGRSKILNWFARLIIRKSSLVIVTNDNLRTVCEKWGGNAFVMPDPIPTFNLNPSHGEAENSDRPKKFSVLFICSWSDDEPYQTALAALERFSSHHVDCVVTGNYRAKIDPADWPSIEFTGFIPRENYLERLRLCDAVIVLTTRQDCLNCGAYEAIAAGKPGVLSDTSSLRLHFERGFVFANNSAEDILIKMEYLMAHLEQLSSEVSSLKEQLINKTRSEARDLISLIG